MSMEAKCRREKRATLTFANCDYCGGDSCPFLGKTGRLRACLRGLSRLSLCIFSAPPMEALSVGVALPFPQRGGEVPCREKNNAERGE